MINKIINHRAIRYLIVGGSNTVISLLLYYFFVIIGINYLIANAICFVIGVILGYTLNAIVVFKHPVKYRALIKYSRVYITSFLISSLMLYCLVKFGGINKIIAQIITVSLITVVNYLMIKKLVFT